MSTYHHASQYQEVGIKTASPLELVVLLYDSAIGNIQKAQERMAARDIPGRTRCLNRATSILAELQASLNFEADGDIAPSLERLYRYMRQRIFHANFHQDSTPLKEIVGLLSTLREAWIATSRTANQKSGQPSGASTATRNHGVMPVATVKGSASSLANLNITA